MELVRQIDARCDTAAADFVLVERSRTADGVRSRSGMNEVRKPGVHHVVDKPPAKTMAVRYVTDKPPAMREVSWWWCPCLSLFSLGTMTPTRAGCSC